MNTNIYIYQKIVLLASLNRQSFRHRRHNKGLILYHWCIPSHNRYFKIKDHHLSQHLKLHIWQLSRNNIFDFVEIEMWTLLIDKLWYRLNMEWAKCTWKELPSTMLMYTLQGVCCQKWTLSANMLKGSNLANGLQIYLFINAIDCFHHVSSNLKLFYYLIKNHCHLPEDTVGILIHLLLWANCMS